MFRTIFVKAFSLPAAIALGRLARSSINCNQSDSYTSRITRLHRSAYGQCGSYNDRAVCKGRPEQLKHQIEQEWP